MKSLPVEKYKGKLSSQEELVGIWPASKLQRARESLDERNAENVADRLRRARARSDQQMANRVNFQAETNVSEDDCVRGKGDQAIAVASTGIAATFLSGGRTAHSIFKIPLTLNATSTCNLKPNTSEAKILLDAKVIVWDEAPMTHVHAFLAVDRLLKDLTKCDEPFGGKIILLGGDFCQVLPVILRGSRSLTVSSCIKKHRLWSDFFVMKLTENMRAFDSEKEFASWLLHVGEGESGEKIQLPPFCYPEIQDPVQQLFSDIDFKTVTPEELKGRAILTVTNDLSMQINNRVLECMPGNEVIYESIDNIESNDPQDHLAYTEEFLNSLTPTGMPPHKLRLKPGTIIMLLRNLAPSKGLCNGTRLIVIQLQKNAIVAKKISADNNNESYLIPRIPLIPSDSNMPFQFQHKQFPIKLAFSMTINKAQGQTFDKICLDLSKPVFSHGQLYVGLSRVRSFDSVTVVSPNSEIYNCVYREVL
ncbi:ATP-dependent DNA helicase PIF1 [Araneus ventricosus]|uniref:ATP-dependent DNA helicase n=1 Tax=Araneus ventricosus TaxID=182803 RepID=A0A4Y2H496_ARAVE|nr:ATP-dependent DNA helicase PIF1 [Araneus ventricosus]